jgi:hypothetical protein
MFGVQFACREVAETAKLTNKQIKRRPRACDGIKMAADERRPLREKYQTGAALVASEGANVM